MLATLPETPARAMLLHDLRGALTVLDGLMELQRRVKDSAHLSHSRDVVEKIRMLSFLLEDNLQSKAMELIVRHPQPSSPFLERILAAYEPRAHRLGVWLRGRFASDLPAFHGDPLQLDRIFSNLVENALKHTPPGGSVWVEASPWTETSGPRPWIRVDVADSGLGMDPRQIDRIFEAGFFERGGPPGRSAHSASPSSSPLHGWAKPSREVRQGIPDVPGCGLGLTIVDRLVKAHGGRIQVLSRPAQGTRFSVLLPGTTSGPGSCDPTVRD